MALAASSPKAPRRRRLFDHRRPKFMERYAPSGKDAPRDMVSRAMTVEIREETAWQAMTICICTEHPTQTSTNACPASPKAPEFCGVDVTRSRSPLPPHYNMAVFRRILWRSHHKKGRDPMSSKNMATRAACPSMAHRRFDRWSICRLAAPPACARRNSPRPAPNRRSFRRTRPTKRCPASTVSVMPRANSQPPSCVSGCRK